jgi:hypothetical protein
MISVDNLIHRFTLVAARVGCRLDIHGWIYTERPYWADGADGERFRCRCLKRYCMHCGRAQRWDRPERRWCSRTQPPDPLPGAPPPSL